MGHYAMVIVMNYTASSKQYSVNMVNSAVRSLLQSVKQQDENIPESAGNNYSTNKFARKLDSQISHRPCSKASPLLQRRRDFILIQLEHVGIYKSRRLRQVARLQLEHVGIYKSRRLRQVARLMRAMCGEFLWFHVSAITDTVAGICAYLSYFIRRDVFTLIPIRVKPMSLSRWLNSPSPLEYRKFVYRELFLNIPETLMTTLIGLITSHLALFTK